MPRPEGEPFLKKLRENVGKGVVAGGVVAGGIGLLLGGELLLVGALALIGGFAIKGSGEDG